MSDSFDKSKWMQDPSNFEKDKKRNPIKVGFSEVISFSIEKSTKCKCVIKRTFSPLREEDQKKIFNKCIYMLATNEHPAIVPFVGFYEENDYGYIILKEIEKRSLDVLLEKVQKGERDPLFDETHKLIISYGISCAMEFLHKKSILHRNLKSRHVLLDSDLRPYLSGFSCSIQIDPSHEKRDDFTGTTATIMAPEFIHDPETYNVTFPIDVYAYGITLYELITELHPFPNVKRNFQLYQLVIDGERPEIPEKVPENWKNLIERCYSQDPSRRPTFTEICDVLESEIFVNDRIDHELFEKYKKIVKPLRSSSQKSKVDEDLSKKSEKNKNKIKKPTMQKIVETENEIEEPMDSKSTSQSDHNESKKKMKRHEAKEKASAFNPFEEQEKATQEEEGENYFIDDDDQQFYETIKKIGEGATSIVYKAIDTRSNQIICKKVLKILDESSNFINAKNAIKEFEVLHAIQHPCICKANKICIKEPLTTAADEQDDSERTTISLYLEFLPRSLKECIDKKILDNTLKARIAVEVAHALNFIHKNGMIHRDIKIENIMLNSVFEAKVVDFGLVRIDECISGQSFVTTSLTKGVGTLSYMSPEMLSEEDYDGSTDVYSYGIVLYYLLIGKLPQYNMKEKISGKPIPLPEPSSIISEYGIKLIRKCTDYDAKKRPSFEKILQEMREKSYAIAPEIEKSLVSKRDRELSFFESTHNQNKK